MNLPDLVDALTALRDQMAAEGSPYLHERDIELTLEGAGDNDLDVAFETLADADTGLPDHSFAEWDPAAKTWQRYG